MRPRVALVWVRCLSQEPYLATRGLPMRWWPALALLLFLFGACGEVLPGAIPTPTPTKDMPLLTMAEVKSLVQRQLEDQLAPFLQERRMLGSSEETSEPDPFTSGWPPPTPDWISRAIEKWQINREISLASIP